MGIEIPAPATNAPPAITEAPVMAVPTKILTSGVPETEIIESPVITTAVPTPEAGTKVPKAEPAAAANVPHVEPIFVLRWFTLTVPAVIVPLARAVKVPASCVVTVPAVWTMDPVVKVPEACTTVPLTRFCRVPVVSVPEA